MADDKKVDSPVSDVEKNKTNAVLCYLGILIIIPFINEEAKKSPFVKFHLNQGVVLLIGSFVVSAVVWVPIIGWAFGIAFFVIWLMGLLGAIQGQMKRVPVVGNLTLIK